MTIRTGTTIDLTTIFAGAEAGCCSMLLDQPPSAKLMGYIRGNPSILHAVLNACE